jgi:hypothetical protein
VLEKAHGQADKRSERDQGEHSSGDDSRRRGFHGAEFIVCLCPEQRKFQWLTGCSFHAEFDRDRVIVIWTLLAVLGPAG